MSETDEYSDEGIVEDDLNDEDAVEESAEEYGYTEPPAVPAPDDLDDQNPGFVEGAHT